MTPELRARLGRLGGALLLLALIAIAYQGALNAPFVYDDKIEVIGNRTIRLITEWRAVATYNLSRVLVVFSYAWNYHLWERQPEGYHAVNLVIHGLAAIAAWRFCETLCRLGGHRHPARVAWIVVAAWAVHPMSTQAVTYVTGRSESLAALFYLSGLAAWAGALERERAEPLGPGGEIGGRLLGLVAFVLALLSKEVGVMFPVAALALELGVGSGARDGWRARVAEVRWRWYAPMAALIVAAVVMRLRVAGSLLPHEVDRPLPVQIATNAEVWLRYAGQWLAPLHQTLFHDLPDVQPASAHGALVLCGWLLCIAAGVLLGSRCPLAGQSLLTGALFLLPSSSIAPLKETMAEHRSYAFGLFLILGAATALTGPWRRGERWLVPPRAISRAAGLAGIALIGLGVVLTRERNQVWSSEIALWTEATEVSPASAQAWYGLGDANRFASRFEDAIAAYRNALGLDPKLLDAWNNIGISQAELGDLPAAYQSWRSALRMQPSYCKAHNNIGFMALRRREWDLALSELNSTLAYCQNNALAHWGLGNIYYGPRRDPRQAAEHYQKVLEIDPGFDHKAEIEQRLLELTW